MIDLTEKEWILRAVEHDRAALSPYLTRALRGYLECRAARLISRLGPVSTWP